MTTKGAFDIVPAIICGSVPTPATRRAAGLPAGGFLALGLGLALAGPAAAQQQPPVDLATRFAQRVDAYEAADKATPPPTGAILLAGDSQFDRWKTFQEDLAGYTVINRGIDSFRTDDVIQYVDRLVIRYKPRMVVLHVGGNDISRGKSPEQLLADTKTLVGEDPRRPAGRPDRLVEHDAGPGPVGAARAAQGRQRAGQGVDRDREGPVLHRPVGCDADRGRPAARGPLGGRSRSTRTTMAT